MATFSNGHEHKYGGKREVKAAWMVVLPNGRILSGHSVDRRRAESTARGNAVDRAPVGQLLKRGALPVQYIAYQDRIVKDHGFKTVREYNAYVTREREKFVAQCKIEVIDL